jgi:hypothetical protein
MFFIHVNCFHSEHHVKFNEEHDNYNKQNSINIQKISQWKFQVHLGFLKLNNTYEIVIDVGPILESPQSPDINTAWISNVTINPVFFLSICFSIFPPP